MVTPARTLTAGLVVGATLLAGCAHRTVEGKTVIKTVVVAPTPTPSTSSSTTSAPPPTPSSSSPKPTPSRTKAPPPKFTRLDARCHTALKQPAVEKAYGTKLRGTIAYEIGRGDPTIGRLMYINCKYGVSPAKGASVEITVSLYRSTSSAGDRVRGTIQDFISHGASSSGTTVNQRPATLLLGANMLSYGPTLVFHAGLRTIAVTLRGDTSKPTPILERIAALAGRSTQQLS